ncbi:lumazine synthase [Naganishia albida]|nr:lumazine synthase [Naganishia albida]
MTDATIKGLPPPPVKYDGSSQRILIVHARWNDTIIKSLVSGCVAKLKEQGVKEENIVIKTVPGSYELPFATQRLIAGSQTQSSVNAPSLLGASSANLVNLLTSEPTPQAPTNAPTASTGPFSAAISIGCLIKGSTMHFEYICDAVTHGLMRVQLDTGVPVIFGVLTALNDDQALERAGLGRNGNKGHNHGEDWALAAVELAAQSAEWSKGNI